uniref:Putative secreted protein n=1 Tax=Anopheles darlingi TaxID=43151 RepID=A0A2M4D2Q5_ANODA
MQREVRAAHACHCVAVPGLLLPLVLRCVRTCGVCLSSAGVQGHSKPTTPCAPRRARVCVWPSQMRIHSGSNTEPKGCVPTSRFWGRITGED